MQHPTIDTLWTTLNTPLERFIRSRVPDAQTADDLLQDVYIKIHTHLDGVRDEERLRAWVYQIARNVIHDYYRSHKPTDELPDALIQVEDDDDEDITEQLAISVRGMIDLLPAEYREALILTEIDGLTQAELAARLGISVSGAKSRVQRGRKLLRALLYECCHFEFDRQGKVIDYYPRCNECACAPGSAC
jgi:RNA polymerase sigma-70 factor (ECF subfamily)